MMPRWTKSNRNPLGVLRADAGFSRESAASTLDISLSTMIRYETCETDIPIGIVEAMAIIYKVPFDKMREAIKQVKEAKGFRTVGHYSKALTTKPKVSVEL